MESVTLEKVNENVESLRKMVLVILGHIEDSQLTSEEEELLDEYLNDKKKNRLTSLEDLKAELGSEI